MQVYLSLGSNLAYPTRQIRQAIIKIRKHPKITLLKTAQFYHNKARGRKTQPNFCNTVIKINTTLTAIALLEVCQHIEHEQGRVRKVKDGARTLDIDILLFGQKRFNYYPKLIIPHPRMEERDFVLIPLAELNQ